MKSWVISLVMLWVTVATAAAQVTSEPENIRITDVRFEVFDDSLHINCRIQVNGIDIKAHQLLKLQLSIGTEKKNALLPPILYAGRLRHRYDRRTALLTGQAKENKPFYVYTHVRKKNVYSLDYQAKIPYGHWLDDAALTLRQTFESNGYVIENEQRLSEKLEFKDERVEL